MREIIFRGRRMGGGGWVEGDLRQYVSGAMAIKNNSFPLLLFEVEPETVGQYSGWKDRNDKRVFEGDILRVTDKTQNSRVHPAKVSPSMVPRVAEVRFHCGMFGLFKPNNGGMMIFVPEAWGNIEIEVIGNIHDNPELLEEK